MKPKVSIKKWDITNGAFPVGSICFVLPFPSVGYQVLWDGVVIARSTDKNLARRIVYHLKKKWNK